jgi:histidyl-tRNA synthetase
LAGRIQDSARKNTIMAKKKKAFKPKARTPKGLQDEMAGDVIGQRKMLAAIAKVYELYGFDPLETSGLEYADTMGKFLPDADRPNQGVFSFQDDDDQWLSLRYDLTAPLARFVAQNYDALPKPFRRYQTGPVWRNEKPGPGHFRQFTQFDADTVGTPSMAADAEMCMLMCDAMEAIGIDRGDYEVRVNNRKVLDGVFDVIGLGADDEDSQQQRLTVLRAIDKLDRLGEESVERLLGKGRKDDSGDYTEGAKLRPEQIEAVMSFVRAGKDGRSAVCDQLATIIGESEVGGEGVAELREIDVLLSAAGYDETRVVFDPAIVRGLEYYTGPVWEVELTFEIEDDKGRPIRFGAAGGGGRYDGLVERFKGVRVPATGCSIGVSRLYAALKALGKARDNSVLGPVVVLIMDADETAGYQTMVQDLRKAGIRSELYLGGSGMKAQLKYADRRGASVVVIEGDDEREKGEVTLKDLVLGSQMSKDITDNKAWREDQPAQVSVTRGDLVSGVAAILARYTQGSAS